MKMLRCCVQSIALACLICTAISDGWAQSYPTKAVRCIVPDAAGGGLDTIGRLTAEGLAEAFGQQVIVDNRSGAGTTLGIALAAKAPPDGYTLLMNGSGLAAASSLYRNLTFDAIRDFVPVTQIAASPQLVVVHPSLPVRSISDLVKLAKAKPGAIIYASAGTGSSTFFATELFKERAGVNLVHVPYRGGGPALTSVIAGETPIYFAPVAAAMPHLQSRLRAVAVSALQRLAILRDVPTVAESGYPGFEAGNWYGLMVPTGTPPETIAIIHRAALTALNKLQKRLHELAYIPVGSRPDEYAAYIKAEIQKVAATYQRLGLTPN